MLRYEGWSHISRLQQAATFRSRPMKRHTDPGTVALHTFQLHVNYLGSMYGPDEQLRFGKNVFIPIEEFNPLDLKSCYYGLETEAAVHELQKQFKFKHPSGVAGVDTMRYMDKFLMKYGYHEEREIFTP